MTLGESIAFYRRRAGLSQEALAERVGVSRQAVSKWELGDAAPEVSKLVALAAVFGITTDQLLSGEAPQQAPPAPEGPAAAQERPHRGAWGRIERMVGRYGWLAGIYIALRGLGVTVVGCIARFAFGRMFRVAVDGFGGFGGMTVTDAAGAPVDLPPEVMEDLMGQIGGGLGGMVSGQVTVISDMGKIFLGFATIFIVIGVVIMIAGAVLAAVLYRRGRTEKGG